NKLSALDQIRPLVIEHRQPRFSDPVADRVPMHSEHAGYLINRVAAQRLDASPVRPAVAARHPADTRSISERISSTRHAVTRGPILIGFGKRPDFTPAHQVDLLTGMGPRGARMARKRTNPVRGSSLSWDIARLRLVKDGAVLGRIERAEA